MTSPWFIVLAFIQILFTSQTISSSDLDAKPLKIAAFNVRIFGLTKMSKPAVVETLVKVILRYDIILIQEIRDSSDSAIFELQKEVNKKVTSGFYSLILSARSGRSASKEQYAFFYKNDTLTVKGSYNYDDGDEATGKDTFEREPFVVRFNSLNTEIKDFACVAIHTSPSTAVSEIDALAAVYDDVVSKWNLHDVMIMGDFNAACSYVRDADWSNIKLATDKRFYWMITECIDTTVGGGVCAYDRFVIAGDALKDAVVVGSGQTFKFDEKYGLDETEALEISDHYPVEIKIHDAIWSSINTHLSLERQTSIKDDRMTKFSRTLLYSLRKSENPLLKKEGFTLEQLYKKTGGVLNIILVKTVVSEDEAVKAVGTIQKYYPSIVTKEQVKSTRPSIQSLSPHLPTYSFPYQTLRDRTLSSLQYKIELFCEFILNSCWINVAVF